MLSQPLHPKSRQTGLLIDHVGDETIVYDEERQEAHSLNRSASTSSAARPRVT